MAHHVNRNDFSIHAILMLTSLLILKIYSLFILYAQLHADAFLRSKVG